MTIILSEQEKIELEDAQKNGYLFKDVMSEFSGWKEECPVCHKKKVEMFRTSEQIVFLQHWKNCSLSPCSSYHMIKGGCGNSWSNISFHFSNKLEHQLEKKRNQQAKWQKKEEVAQKEIKSQTLVNQKQKRLELEAKKLIIKEVKNKKLRAPKTKDLKGFLEKTQVDKLQ